MKGLLFFRKRTYSHRINRNVKSIRRLFLDSSGRNRPGQALIGLSLAYEKNHKPEPGLWPIIGRFSRPGLTYLKAWTGLKAYLQTYFTLRPSNSSFDTTK
ncbi:hypothetical protein MTR_6g092550 [Medicago truncatula]|uniref:Uncharacterized protein n=1 Tax=Medicago truncatula TaxID=3880 RepID=G7KJU0_MEDTR|nr:hypothetical protein MTR_6g092550 [Medicago truncatula]